ncbi:MAG: hypothetical protein GY865_02970, partial [candidate division Zixibacteria bacterium]|nr:hypothetical protein [candidate division Zixibacteria bacterium]
MKVRTILIIILVLSFIFSGCGKKFRLERDIDYSYSIWPYSGGYDGGSKPDKASEFSGNLNLKWKRKVLGSTIGPLSIGGGKLIACTTTGRVRFYDLKNGKYLGKYKTRANVQTGLTVVDSLAYFASGPVKNLFVCLNLHNRKTLWRTKI